MILSKNTLNCYVKGDIIKIIYKIILDHVHIMVEF